jgi:hypothetical protein
MDAVEIFKKHLENEVLYFTEYRDSVYGVISTETTKIGSRNMVEVYKLHSRDHALVLRAAELLKMPLTELIKTPEWEDHNKRDRADFERQITYHITGTISKAPASWVLKNF